MASSVNAGTARRKPESRAPAPAPSLERLQRKEQARRLEIVRAMLRAHTPRRTT